MPGTEDTGVACGQHFMRAGTDLYCELDAGHSTDHGLLADQVRHPARPEPPRQTTQQQRAVFERAMEIFMERTLENGELWKTVEPIDTAHHIRHKSHRIYFAARRLEIEEGIADKNKARIIESALDTINYCAFIVRQIEEEE